MRNMEHYWNIWQEDDMLRSESENEMDNSADNEATDIPSLVDPDAPGVVSGEVVDEMAYYAYRAPFMKDYQIEFFYADAKTTGNAELMAIFEAEGIKRGVDLSPLPPVVIWRQDEETGKYRREIPGR